MSEDSNILSPAHRRELEIDSGIPAAIIAQRGYLTIHKKVDLKQ